MPHSKVDRLAQFLYLIMRDKLNHGELRALIEELPSRTDGFGSPQMKALCRAMARDVFASQPTP